MSEVRLDCSVMFSDPLNHEIVTSEVQTEGDLHKLLSYPLLSIAISCIILKSTLGDVLEGH